MICYFLLQVCHYLMAGQVKSVKPCLKQLQQSIQTIMAPTWPDDDGEFILNIYLSYLTSLKEIFIYLFIIYCTPKLYDTH